MDEHLEQMDWWIYTGHWTEDGDYDPEAAPVVLPHTLDLPGEAHA